MAAVETGRAREEARGSNRLATKTQFADNATIALDVNILQVVQKATAAPDKHQETTAAVVVLLVHLEMGGQMIDPISKQGNLDLGGAGVVLAFREPLDRFIFWRKVGCGLTHGGITLEIAGLD